MTLQMVIAASVKDVMFHLIKEKQITRKEICDSLNWSPTTLEALEKDVELWTIQIASDLLFAMGCMVVGVQIGRPSDDENEEEKENANENERIH